MLTPIELMKATVDAMAERGFGRIVNITSGAVKAPIDTLGLSNGARSGLTGFVAGLARQRAGRPQRHDQQPAARRLRHRPRCARRCKAQCRQEPGRAIEARAAASARGTVPAQRFGTAEEFGAVCAFLCSAQAGYITGAEHAARRRGVSGHVLTKVMLRRRLSGPEQGNDNARRMPAITYRIEPPTCMRTCSASR